MADTRTENSWDYSVFWTEAIKQLQDELSPQEISLWFNQMEYDHSDEGQIFVSVPSSFYRDQVRQRYLSLIESRLHELSGGNLVVEFLVRTARHHTAPESRVNGNHAKSTPNAEPPAEELPREPHPQLNDTYNFDSFVIGTNNSFAANAAMAIARNPGMAYNPCLIYGGVGLGKTHLVQSIGNAIHQNFRDRRVSYINVETFINEFVTSIRENRQHIFKNKYRLVDVLLMDDIQFLQKTNESQEEMFHTFNALYESNKQMVFTCDRPVSEIKITDRLRSRFERGLNVDLQPPSYETRFAILKRKVESKGLHIPENVVELICENVTTNVRDLEKALTKLVAYAELVNKNISLEVAQQQLRDFFASPAQGNVTIDLILRTVADYFNISSHDIKSKKKTRAITFPRQVAMYIARDITEYSTTEIGLEMGGRDHTTVMHGCQRIEDRMKLDPSLDPTVHFLIRRIKEQSTR